MSFDRVNLLNGRYDHGGLYCWKAYDPNNNTAFFDNPATKDEGDLDGTVKTNFPSGNPLNYIFYRQWGRRDFYNSADSFGEYIFDINTDIFDSVSNTSYLIGDNNFLVKIR